MNRLRFRFDSFHRNWTAGSHAWPGAYWIVTVESTGKFLSYFVGGPTQGADIADTFESATAWCASREAELGTEKIAA